MSVESVVVAIDGESKTGTTTIINKIADEALYQQSYIPRVLEPENLGVFGFSSDIESDIIESLTAYHEAVRFNHISTISGGNVFRAAALYVALLELEGHKKQKFDEGDYASLRHILDLSGIEQVLQEDSNVGNRVSSVAKYAGVQALCGAIFCDLVVDDYYAEGGGNLVIVDARDPIGHMKRNNVLGDGPRQINPKAIIPIYVETPADVAAKRLGGDYNEKLEYVAGRRALDASREELPVMRPDDLIADFESWIHQFTLAEAGRASGVASPYVFHNGEEVVLDNIQYFAGVIALNAHNSAYCLKHPEAIDQKMLDRYLESRESVQKLQTQHQVQE